MKMKIRKTISLALIVAGIFLITRVSYAWVNPGPYGPNDGLDFTLLDDNGIEIPKEGLSGFKLFNEDNIYPGWSNSYTLRIKNRSLKAAYYTVGLEFEENPEAPKLSDVLTLRVVRDNRDNIYSFADLTDKPLQDKTRIGAGEAHTFYFTLSMDPEAGNEYMNLSLDVVLTVAAELASEPGGPGDDGGGGDGPGTTDPGPGEEPENPELPEEPDSEEPGLDEPEPGETPGGQSPDEQTYEGSGADGTKPDEHIPDHDLPDRGGTADVQDIILPKTGGIPLQVPLAAGVLMIAAGILIRRES